MRKTRLLIALIFLSSCILSRAADEPASPSTPTTQSSTTSSTAVAEHVDEITVKGDVVRGKITEFTDTGVVMSTLYGSGDIVVKYADVQGMRSFGTYRFIEYNGTETHGRITSFNTKELGVESLTGKESAIHLDSISRVVRDNDEAKTFLERLKNRYPFTSIKLDFSWNIENGAVEKIMVAFGLNVERRKAPTRIVLDANAAYELDKSPPDSEVVSKEEFQGSLIGEYDLNKKLYLFLFPAASRDIPRGIDLRFYPAVGTGYRFAESQRWRFQLQVGLAYVYEEFINYPSNEYAAAHLGTEWGYTFKNGNTLGGSLYYYPGLKNGSKNWLFRGTLEYNAKITKYLGFKIKFTDTLDDNPAPDVGDNKFTTSMGLSLMY